MCSDIYEILSLIYKGGLLKKTINIIELVIKLFLLGK